MDDNQQTQIWERIRADVRIEEDFRKQQNRQALRIQFERQKNLVRENERELKSHRQKLSRSMSREW